MVYFRCIHCTTIRGPPEKLWSLSLWTTEQITSTEVQTHTDTSTALHMNTSPWELINQSCDSLTVKWVSQLTGVHGAGALWSCQTPWCSASPAVLGSILAHEAPPQSLSLPGIDSVHWSIPSLCPRPLSSSASWCSTGSCECECECVCVPLSEPPSSSRLSCPAVGVALFSLAEPANAARRTSASSSAVCSIDGVAEGMLTQHEFSPFPALVLPPLLSLSQTHTLRHKSTHSLTGCLPFYSDPFSLAFRCQRPDLPVKPDQTLAALPTALPGPTAHLSHCLPNVHALRCMSVLFSYCWNLPTVTETRRHKKRATL